MSRETLQSILMRYEEIEREFKMDMFSKICDTVHKYKTDYSSDEWIDSFVYDYLRYHQKRKI